VFVIILSVYALVNVYVFIRGWQALEGLRFRWIYAVAMPLLAVSFIGAQLLKQAFDMPVIDFFWWLGSLWLVALLYVFLSIALIDLVRFVLRGFGEKPAMLLHAHYGMIKQALFCAVALITGILLTVGYYNATRPKVNTVDIEIDKQAAGRSSLTVVVAADLHLGCINGRSALRRWVDAINALQPDVVLLPGDVFDDNPASVVRKKLGDILSEIKAPLGVYFAPGNHEGYGNLPQAMEYLNTHRVQVLPDEVILVDSCFYVAGRLDRSVERNGVERKSLQALTAGLDQGKPVFLLDHQPAQLEEAVAAGIDLQVSGHTHRGQLWPFSLLTKRIYELDWGYLRKGNTHFYVTQGVGTWGPPVRLGTRSEIVRLNVHFTN
jgi:predicted MPP superfamily phosphohydrolase